HKDAHFFKLKDVPFEDKHIVVKCPYGKIGDVLWVRETSRINYEEYNIPGGISFKKIIEYKADYKNDTSIRKWKPSIFMPKAACRIFLEITDIKVERLQDISGEDAINEGVKVTSMWPLCIGDAYRAFKSLWQKINGKNSWEVNLFVWVISFRKINKPKNFNQ
ncbi:MAG TPA: hypothetical protein VIQ00_11425, partial [Chitinophagaceae bacterium]